MNGREWHNFFMVHSIIELHPIYQDNMSLVSTIFKSFTNNTPRLHLARITLTNMKSHQVNNQRHKNYKTWSWLSLGNHTRVLQTNHKPKCLQDQPKSSIFTLQRVM